MQNDFTGDVCIPSQPPPHLVHVWVPVFIVCCLGSCAVHPGEECWLGQVHGRRADPKDLSNPLLDSLPHIPAKNSQGQSVTPPSFRHSLLLPQLRNMGFVSLGSFFNCQNIKEQKLCLLWPKLENFCLFSWIININTYFVLGGEREGEKRGGKERGKRKRERGGKRGGGEDRHPPPPPVVLVEVCFFGFFFLIVRISRNRNYVSCGLGLKFLSIFLNNKHNNTHNNKHIPSQAVRPQSWHIQISSSCPALQGVLILISAWFIFTFKSFLLGSVKASLLLMALGTMCVLQTKQDAKPYSVCQIQVWKVE